jgi:hypothetical protein
MPKLTIIDQAALHYLHARAKWFLWDQRHRKGNSGWFTVADIMSDLPKRPPAIPLLVALDDLAEAGHVENDGEGRLRHT